MLPHVVRFNAGDPSVARTYAELACTAGISSASEVPSVAAERLAAHIEKLLDLAGLPRSLKDCGAHNGDIVRLADEASSQWTAQFNPRPLTRNDFQQLYAQALT